MGDESNMYEDDLLEEDNSEEELSENNIEDPIDFSAIDNVLASSSTTVKVYSKDIDKSDLEILKDVPGAWVMIIHDLNMERDDKLCEDMLNDKDSKEKYSIIFIKEDIVQEISDILHIVIDYQDILKAEDVENEATAILAG